jgi:hypothetical protein
MQMYRAGLVLLLISLLNVSSIAQGEGTLPSLTLQRSLPLVGAGWIGAAKPNNDPVGYYLNPAILGYTSQNNHASLFFMPTKTEWLPTFGGDVTLNTVGFNLGYNLKEYNLPISVGFGYSYDKFDFGTFYRTGPSGPEIIGEFDPYDKFHNFSFGVGIDYYFLFNFGLSIKSYSSSFNSLPTENEVGSGEIRGTAFDYGAMIITPISKLLFSNAEFDITNISSIKPLMNFIIGYSPTNVGDEVVYNDEAQSDPLARTGRLGYTFDFGFDAFINKNKINLITYSFTAEANDILIEQDDRYQFTGYQSFLGDIDINEHLIQLKGDEEVVVHKGHTISIFETLTILSGHFFGRGFIEDGISSNGRASYGYGISTEGILKLWSFADNNKTLNYIANHFVIEYYDVVLYASSYFETKMDGISLHMKNIEL